MAKLKNHLLKAFTLVETIVSLILISVSFGICLMLFNQVSTDQNIKQEASFIADQYFVKLEEGTYELESESFQVGELEVVVQVEPYESVEHALAIRLTVLQKEDVLYSTQKIILEDDVEKD